MVEGSGNPEAYSKAAQIDNFLQDFRGVSSPLTYETTNRQIAWGYAPSDYLVGACAAVPGG